MDRNDIVEDGIEELGVTAMGQCRSVAGLPLIGWVGIARVPLDEAAALVTAVGFRVLA